MFIRSLSLLLLLTYAALAQTTKIQGVVKDDTGATPSGLYVVATSQGNDHHTYTTTTGAKGDYTFNNIPPGKYNLCVQAPGGPHLNNCEYSAPAQVTLATSQSATQNISVTQGAVFQLRLDDPRKLITPVDDIFLVVHLPNGLARPMRLASSDATGRTYDAPVPLKTSVRLSIISSHLQIADDKNNSLAPKSAAANSPQTSGGITFPGQSAVHGPPVTFTVTGRK